MSWSIGFAILLLAGRTGGTDVRTAYAEGLSGLEQGVSVRELDDRASRIAQLPDATAAWLEIEAADAAPGTESETLTGVQGDLLDRIASRLPRELVLEGVRSAAATNAAEPWRLAAFKLLEKHASAEELPLLVDLVRGGESALAAQGPLVDAFESTLVAVARRDVRLIGRTSWFTENAPALRPAFVRVLGASGDPEAIPVLAGMLQDKDLALPSIRQLAKLASKAPPSSRADLAARVRPFVEWSDEATRRHALRILVALEDEESIPVLLKIVETESPIRRDAEFEALRGLTGRNLPAEAARWRQWYEDDKRWIEQDATAAIGRLSSEKPAVVVEAIREISGHVLERPRLAEALSGVLREHPSAAVRNQACLALARLRSRAALDALTAALSDADPVVAGNAWNALRAISGLALPLNEKAWRDALRTGT